MMRGTITARREALLPLIVRGSGGQDAAVDAVLDTGFDGDLSLPPARVSALGLTYYGRTIAELADGTTIIIPVYRAVVAWTGRDRAVDVLATGNDPILGMSLLYGSRVTLDVIDGGTVQIEALP